MSPRRASQPPPLPPLRACPDTSPRFARVVPGQTLAAPSRSRRGQNNQNKTTCETNVPCPTPSPASRLPGHDPRCRSGRARPDCSLPPPAPGGGKITKTKPRAKPTSRAPPPPPLRVCPDTTLAVARDVPGRTARCPLPLPEGAFNYINTYHSTQLLCVRPTLARTTFFPLRGHSPGSMPRFASAWAQANALAKVLRLRTP